MNVAELVSTRQFRLAEMPSEDPAPGEVQVRVEAVGVCGSDLHYYSEGAVGDTPCVFPMVMGHEPSGTVVKCGAGVTGWSPGDRAALEPALYCYHCEFCRTGHHNVCANIRFLSTPGYPGFFREFVNLPSANLLAIPKEMSMELATVAEPLAVALHSMKFAAIDAGRYRGRVWRGTDRSAHHRVREDCRRRADLGSGPGAASPRIGQADGRRCGARRKRCSAQNPYRYRQTRRRLRHRLRRQAAHHQRGHPRRAQRAAA